MNVYKYQVYTADRQIRIGEISAASDIGAEQAIHKMGYTRILSLKPQSLSLREQIIEVLTRKKVTDRDVMEFANELAQLLGSGIALMKALDFVGDVTKNKSMKSMIDVIIQSINNGNSFSQAISEQDGVFSETFIQVIRASEKSGNLERGLTHMAEHMNKLLETKKRLKRVFAYPAVILSLAFGVALFLVFYIMPSMASVFRTMSADLPTLTQTMINISDFASNNIVALLAVIGGLGLGGWLYARTENGRHHLHKLLLRIPIINGMVLTSNMLTYSYMSAMLLKSGLQLPQVLFYTGNTVGNTHLRGILLEARNQLLQGQTLTKVIKQTGIFSRMEIEKIAIGERTGDIVSAFEYIAAANEKALEERRAAFVATIEPMITIGIGVVVALIALSTILPMYSLAGQFE